jgi:hypothetical protein
MFEKSVGCFFTSYSYFKRLDFERVRSNEWCGNALEEVFLKSKQACIVLVINTLMVESFLKLSN